MRRKFNRKGSESTNNGKKGFKSNLIHLYKSIALPKSIRKKIIFSFGLVLLVSIGLAIYSIVNIQKANQLARELILEESAQLNELQDLRFNMSERLRLVNEYMLAGSPEVKKRFNSNARSSSMIEKELLKQVEGKKSEEKVKKLIKDGTKWNTVMMNEVYNVYDTGDHRQALLNVGSEQFKAEQTMSTLKALAEENNNRVEKQGNEIINNGNVVRGLTIILTIFVTIISILVAVILTNSIYHPIRRVSERIKEVAEGDFSKPDMNVTSNDEIGELTMTFNRMVKDLRELIHQAYITTSQVSASAEELTASSFETTKGTEKITHSIQEVAFSSQKQLERVNDTITTMNELNNSIATLILSAQELENSANSVGIVSENGNRVSEHAIAQMAQINEAVIEVSTIIDTLGNRSNEISQITKVITGIAEQTNLLALNAAIEAARAGEHGKGFAVVADEVRKLAVQSKNSSQEIIELIFTIKNDTVKAINAMKKSTIEVNNGSIAVEETGSSFKNISESIADIRTTITSINEFVKSMSKSTQNVSLTINDLTDIAMVNSSYSHEVASSAEAQLITMEDISSSTKTVNGMAISLKEVLRKFKI